MAPKAPAAPPPTGAAAPVYGAIVALAVPEAVRAVTAVAIVEAEAPEPEPEPEPEVEPEPEPAEAVAAPVAAVLDPDAAFVAVAAPVAAVAPVAPVAAVAPVAPVAPVAAVAAVTAVEELNPQYEGAMASAAAPADARQEQYSAAQVDSLASFAVSQVS